MFILRYLTFTCADSDQLRQVVKSSNSSTSPGRLSDLLEVSCLLLLPLGHPLLLNLASVRRQLFVTRPN